MSSTHSKDFKTSFKPENMKSEPFSTEAYVNPKLKTLCTMHGDLPSADNMDPVETALYTINQFDLKESEAAPIRFTAIQYSFNYHFEHNAFYRRFCETSGVRPTDLQGPEDLHRLPLVPEHIFKGCTGTDEFVSWLASITSDELPWPESGELQGTYDEQISTLKKDYRILVRSTSGSSGVPSFLPRDPITRRRSAHWKILSYLSMHPEMFTVDDLLSVTLWPLDFSWADLIVPPERVHALLDKKLGLETVTRAMTRPPEKGSIFDRLMGRSDSKEGPALLDGLVNRLTDLVSTDSPGIIWAPPFLIYALACYLRDQKLQLEGF